MSRGEALEAILQDVIVRLSADGDSLQRVLSLVDLVCVDFAAARD